jgi:hypothetical protein
MTAINPQDLTDYPDVFAVGDRLHRPTDAPDDVRRAWTNYLAVQATAELGFVRTVELLREVVAKATEVGYSTARRQQGEAYRAYLAAIGEAFQSDTELGPVAEYPERLCSVSPDRSAAGQFTCTRPVWHNGPHVAHGRNLAPIATWTDTEPTPRLVPSGPAQAEADGPLRLVTDTEPTTREANR